MTKVINTIEIEAQTPQEGNQTPLSCTSYSSSYRPHEIERVKRLARTIRSQDVVKGASNLSHAYLLLQDASRDSNNCDAQTPLLANKEDPLVAEQGGMSPVGMNYDDSDVATDASPQSMDEISSLTATSTSGSPDPKKARPDDSEPSLSSQVDETTSKHGMQANRQVIEIQESTVTSEPEGSKGEVGDGRDIENEAFKIQETHFAAFK